MDIIWFIHTFICVLLNHINLHQLLIKTYLDCQYHLMFKHVILFCTVEDHRRLCTV
jgi:hypothetical protein